MEKGDSLRDKFFKYNVRINIVNGISASIAFNLVPPYFPKLAERLGANDFHIGLLSSLPAIATILFLIPGAMVIEGFKDKKKVTGVLLFIHKLFYLAIALVPFLPRASQPLVFVSLVGIMNLPGAISAMGFQSTIADMFGPETLGQAMAARNKYSTIFGTIVAFLAGQVLSRLTNSQSRTIVLYQAMLVGTFIIAMGEVYSYFKFRGVRTSKQETAVNYRRELKTTFRYMLREKNFLIFGVCSLIFYFGWQMGWPLFNIYMLNNLHADEKWMALIQVASSLSSILTYGLWARFADRKGNNFALFIATVGMSITPVLYAISGNLVTLALYNIVVGISVAGTVQILFNMLIEVTPQKNRTIYIAIYNTAINMSAAIAPMIGVAINRGIQIYWALIVVAGLRFLGSLSFLISNKHFRKVK